MIREYKTIQEISGPLMVVNRCVRKSFSIVLDAIVEITIGAQRAALRKHRDERRQHS